MTGRRMEHRLFAPPPQPHPFDDIDRATGWLAGTRDASVSQCRRVPASRLFAGSSPVRSHFEGAVVHPFLEGIMIAFRSVGSTCVRRSSVRCLRQLLRVCRRPGHRRRRPRPGGSRRRRHLIPANEHRLGRVPSHGSVQPVPVGEHRHPHGNVIFSFTDLVLPGNAGFRLAIQRTLNDNAQPGSWSWGVGPTLRIAAGEADPDPSDAHVAGRPHAPTRPNRPVRRLHDRPPVLARHHLRIRAQSGECPMEGSGTSHTVGEPRCGWRIRTATWWRWCRPAD